MASLVRTVMMWLLMAALPVQSWAAATLVNCGPTHHRMAGQANVAGESGHDHAAHHHDMAVDEHADGHAAPHAGHHADQDQADTDEQPLPPGKFKCSACASCCLGMALPSSILSFEAGVSSETVKPGKPQGHVVFLTTGPERPPRTVFA